MGMKPPPIGNWDRPNCKISITRDEAGNPVLYEGIYGNALTQAAFHIHRQAAGEYLMRGSVSFRSVTDSTRVLRSADGRALAKDIRSKWDDEEKIKKKIVKAFETLYVANLNAIYHDLGSTRLDDLTLLAVIALQAMSYFLKDRRIVEHNIAPRIRAMERVGVKLEEYRMDQIPQSALRKARSELGDTADTAINDICLLISYLQRKGLIHCENAFARYLKDNPRARNKTTEELIRAADRAQSLSEETQDGVDERIRSAPPEDANVTGLLLMGHCGISKEALFGPLFWGDILFEETGPAKVLACRIRVWSDKRNSATCIYTRPTTAWDARELKRRLDALQAADPEICRKRIMEGVSPEAFTRFCRNTLRFCKTTYETICDARTFSSGGGVNLLRSNFRYRLMQYCGVWRSSELDYLLMNMLRNDVTMDNYCSLSSPQGQRRIQLLLNRDKRYALLPPSTEMTLRTEEGPGDRETTISIPPTDPALTTRAKCLVHLHAGECITFMGDGGLTVRTIRKDTETVSAE